MIELEMGKRYHLADATHTPLMVNLTRVNKWMCYTAGGDWYEIATGHYVMPCPDGTFITSPEHRYNAVREVTLQEWDDIRRDTLAEAIKADKVGR